MGYEHKKLYGEKNLLATEWPIVLSRERGQKSKIKINPNPLVRTITEHHHSRLAGDGMPGACKYRNTYVEFSMWHTQQKFVS